MELYEIYFYKPNTFLMHNFYFSMPYVVCRLFLIITRFKKIHDKINGDQRTIY